MKLAGRTAVVTGGGRGIGAAIAEAFVAEGASVVIASRSEVELESVRRKVNAGTRLLAFSCDVSSIDQVTRLVDFVHRTLGGADVLVNNAGIQGPIGRIDDTPLDEWWRTIAVNLGGVVHCCRGFLPRMIERGQGKIINMAGGGATAPRPYFSAYAVSKTAIVRFTENLAAETKDAHIDVNAIAPGLVDTRLQDEVVAAGADASPDYQQIVKARATGIGFVPPTVAAAAAVFLASGASDGLTGKLVNAPHDPWREWDGRGPELSSSPMYSLRRLDPLTIRPLTDAL